MPRRVTEAEIRRAAQQAGIPYRLFYAVVGQESGGRSGAVSPAGARGAAQLMPGTAKALEQRYKIDTSTPFGNLLGGAYYLREQKDRFKTWRLALAAYNAGPGRIKEYGGIPPIKETQNYVRNIMAKAGALTGGESPALGPQETGLQQTPMGPSAPSLTPRDVALQGLRDLSEGDYNPLEGLQGLQEAARAAERAQVAPSTPISSTALSEPQSPARGGGVTYSGEELTHQTSGLAGYPARDIFGKPGTPFLAPESGRVVRLSGRGGTKGGYYGWSIYFQGDSGRKYYIQHLNKDRARRGRYKAGAPLGTISAWEGGAPHAHVGVRESKRR